MFLDKLELMTYILTMVTKSNLEKGECHELCRLNT